MRLGLDDSPDRQPSGHEAEPMLEQNGALLRLLTILAGAVITALALAALLWAVAYFVPRFLIANGDGRVRFLMIGVATALLFLNFLNRQRRRNRRR